MSTPTFIDTLRVTVATMQAQHPAKADAISRAHAAIVEGHVVAQGDGTGRVLSRNGHVWYTVNSHCDCTAADFHKTCRHLSAWKLFQHVQQQHAAETSQAAQEPTSPPQTSVETSHAPDAPTALPEAPCSVNVRLTIQGREVQLTLRDTDEARLLVRLQAVLAQYPTPPPPAGRTPAGEGKDWCPIHNVRMKETTKDGRSWYSHRWEGQWCKGRGGR
jgi:hypothetical protein